jgi:hypothetical protein
MGSAAYDESGCGTVREAGGAGIWRLSPEWWDQIKTFINVGAVFESLRCADIPNFSLCVPPLREQKLIAGFLGVLDLI